MALISWKHVVSMASELDDLDKGAQIQILKFVNTELDVAAFGGETSPKLRLARIYYAAHWGTISSNQSAGCTGPVMNERVGDVHRTYALMITNISNPDSLMATSYGRAYLSLINSTARLRGPLVA